MPDDDAVLRFLGNNAPQTMEMSTIIDPAPRTSAARSEATNAGPAPTITPSSSLGRHQSAQEYGNIPEQLGDYTALPAHAGRAASTRSSDYGSPSAALAAAPIYDVVKKRDTIKYDALLPTTLPPPPPIQYSSVPNGANSKLGYAQPNETFQQ